MFGSLQLQQEIQEVVDLMVERLRTLSRKSDCQFIAVDLRVDMLEKKGCHENGDTGRKTCYSAQELAEFLKKTGFNKDTPVYLTESRWQSSLDARKDLFPKTYTKVSNLFFSYLIFCLFIHFNFVLLLTPNHCV